MSKYRNTVCYDFRPRFLVIFSCNYRYRLALQKSRNTVLNIFISRPPANTTPPPLPTPPPKNKNLVTKNPITEKMTFSIKYFFKIQPNTPENVDFVTLQLCLQWPK